LYEQAGFLADGSFYWPRLPRPDKVTISLVDPSGFNLIIENLVIQVATFVPEHSNGWLAMDSYHLSF
jgi:hypothetical protein